MSTLSSSSTIAQIKASYDDNASYEEDASVSKAKAFITACRLLIRQTPTELAKASGRVQIDVKLIQEEMNEARDFVSSYDTSDSSGADTRVRHADFRNFR